MRPSINRHNSANDNDNHDEQRENFALQELRRQLESSWNIESMGSVPTNPESAADAAASSLLSAMSRSASGSPSSIFLIDILLPSYDITQGTNLYDEVLATEFCIALAKFFKGKSMILMRDGKTLQTVNRILDMREKDRIAAMTADAVDDEEDDDEEEDDEDDDELDDGAIRSTEFLDRVSAKPAADIDAFRQQLMSSWESGSSRTDLNEGNGDDDIPSPPAKPSQPKDQTSVRAAEAPLKRHRLASMFGDAKIAKGPDMTDDAVRAIKANGKPHEDEETIIILSAVSPEEMVGIRGLVSTYGKTKTFVLVNCKINPLPRELIQAETVYSILPLIARPTVSDQNIFGKEASTSSTSEPPKPKVVVMRRYPRDWEVFVDVGRGFELAATAPTSQVDKKGPSMEWIAGCVKRHLQSRLG